MLLTCRIQLILPLFKSFDLLNEFQISETTLLNFTAEVERRYHDVPFHNYMHAWTVLQATVSMLHDLGNFANTFLQKIDVLTLLVAALCHDIGHPGTNNSFQKNSHSSLALLYNDVSILEHHHAASLFQILNSSPDVNVFSGLSKQEYRTVRRYVCSAILSTDMSRHARDLARLQAHIDTPLSREVDDDRQLAVAAILHAADLSNPAREFGLADLWARRLADENSMQVAKEVELQIEVSSSMVSGFQVKNEKFFIHTFVKPFWETLATLLPPLSPYVERVNALLSMYQNLSNSETGVS